MKHTTRLVSVAVAVVSAAALAAPVSAFAGGRPLTTTMTGANEVPGPGDPDGSGTASLMVNVGKAEVCYTLTVENIDTPTAAHIHIAPAGIAGPVVVPLAAPTSGSSSACATVPRDLAQALLLTPENYYVNVHNAAFPAGAIRGQLG